MCGTVDPGSCVRWVLGFGIKTGYDTSPSASWPRSILPVTGPSPVTPALSSLLLARRRCRTACLVTRRVPSPGPSSPLQARPWRRMPHAGVPTPEMTCHPRSELIMTSLPSPLQRWFFCGFCEFYFKFDYVWMKLIEFGCNLIMLDSNWVNLIKVD
jgi:hypothetical protein